jgi:dTDP-4-dehydrorhamnose 3,5-epimerase
LHTRRFRSWLSALTENCELIYFHTADYAPDAEAGLNALDPRLAIAWPMPIAERSARDQQHAMLTSSLFRACLYEMSSLRNAVDAYFC